MKEIGKYEIIHMKVEDYLEDFEGKRFHAVLCDPPYALGFMGEEWDSPGSWVEADNTPYHRHTDAPVYKAGLKFQAWTTEWAKLMLEAEAVYPGTLAMVFGGTRTWHRLASGLEDAGWELWDMLNRFWVYGCLSDDSQILSSEGWKGTGEIQIGEKVCTLNRETNKLEYQPVQRVFLAPYRGTMIRLLNHNTDQLLTPNHNVILKERHRKQKNGVRRSFFDKEWTDKYARDILDWNIIKLPVGANHEEIENGLGEDFVALIGWILAEGYFHKECNAISIYQTDKNAEYVNEIRDILKRMQIKFSEYQRKRKYLDKHYVEHQFYLKAGNSIIHRIKQFLPNNRPTYELIVKTTLEEKRVLFDALIKGDGSESKGRTQFYQKSDHTKMWFQTLCHHLGWQGMINWKRDFITVHKNPMTELQRIHLKKNRLVDYDGLVWCIQVPNGTFMARRNGHIFITGNSGFPKGQDISKLIDKSMGAEREVIGQKEAGIGTSDDYAFKQMSEGIKADRMVDVTAPATPEAKIWDGYKTPALKPAWEPIICVRAPRGNKSYTELALKHGSGCLNVDGCRIGVDSGDWKGKGGGGVHKRWVGEEINNEVYGDGYKRNEPDHTQGRYPPNLVLECTCEKVIPGKVGTPNLNPKGAGFVSQRGIYHGDPDYEVKDEYIRGYNDTAPIHTDPNCPCYMLDEQSGVSKSSGGRIGKKDRSNIDFGLSGKYAKGDPGFGDKGGSSRFFYVAKAHRTEREAGLRGVIPCAVCGELDSKTHFDDDNNELSCIRNCHPTQKPVLLTEWLAKLLLPPKEVGERRLFVPFCGTGSEMIGALKAGWDYVVGVEMNEDYVKIAKARLQFWIDYQNINVLDKKKYRMFKPERADKFW